MKKYVFPLATLLLPVFAQAEILDTLRSYEEARLQTALCNMGQAEVNALEASLVKPSERSKKSFAVMSALSNDLRASRANCNSASLDRIKALEQDLLSADPTFPLDIMKPFTNSESEHRQNNAAEAYIQSKETGVCETYTREDLYNSPKWHKLLLTRGWRCVADNFIRLSANLNAEMNFGNAQRDFDNIEKLSLKELKAAFRQTFKHGVNGEPLRIALVPHLSWENTTLNTIFPYKYFVSKTELTSYKFLTQEFKRLGVPTVFIDRNSLESLDKQVAETKAKIVALKKPHLIISRSMGARVMREILAQNDQDVNEKLTALFNVGGTPHGSVIARNKFHPDVFFRGVVPSVVGSLKLPIGLIAKDPRVPDYIEDTIYSALKRSNLNTMSPIVPRQLTESSVPVLNGLMVRRDHVRAMPLVDPVWMHMIQQGPTEGSSPILGSAVDTSKSMRLILDSDHLGFWKYTPEEALKIYLRLLLTAAHQGLIRPNTP